MRQIGAAENNESRRLIQQKKVLFVQLLKPCCNFKMDHTQNHKVSSTQNILFYYISGD